MNIRELAEQAGLKYHNWITNESNIDDGDFKYPRLEDYKKFAELVAAHEREECADFAERRVLATENNDQKIGYYHACRTIAAGIRARGKA